MTYKLKELILKQNTAKLAEKVLSGGRLSRSEAVELMESADLLSLAYIADELRKQKTGNYAFYTRNLNINHTNICISRCRFCAFSRDAGDKDAYTMSLEEVLKKMEVDGVYEVHIVGGLHPELPLSYYEDMLKAIKALKPDIFIQAFTAVEIDHFSKISGLSAREVLVRLKDSGIDTIPGGGAEIFNPEIRNEICPRKISGERWLEIMETAHSIGIKTNATMLYGLMESAEDRIDHMLKLRELQDRTGGFQAFVPLAFHPKNTDFERFDFTDGVDDLKVLAVSRIVLDNFPHIKALWMNLGIKLAQVSLFFGVDDLGGTCVEEKIVHAAGARTPECITKDELEKVMREAGRIPLECNSGYNVSLAKSL
ncbi:MAG: aminofutalosine synthase MqnE [Firmicutes bacterium]|nr:aminofutalosine synthase MqnE [Bacillota bacterium]